MTKKELSRLYYLNKEIKAEQEKLQQLEALACGATGSISGMPFIGGISDKTSIAINITETREIIQSQIKQSIIEYNRINRYITSIEDSLVRQIISYRFVSGLNWVQAAMNIGGGNTDKGLQMVLKRFLEEN